MIILSQEKIKYVIMKKNLAQNIKKKIDDKASDKSRYTDYRQSLLLSHLGLTRHWCDAL